jgi:hypothetical protein
MIYHNIGWIKYIQRIKNFNTYDLEDVGLEDFKDLIWY